MTKCRCLMADDHPVVRRGVRDLLEAEGLWWDAGAEPPLVCWVTLPFDREALPDLATGPSGRWIICSRTRRLALVSIPIKRTYSP